MPGTRSANRIYLDSNCFIHAMQNTSPNIFPDAAVTCQKLIEEVEKEKLRLISSPLIVSEFLSQEHGEEKTNQIEHYLRAWSHFVPIDFQLARFTENIRSQVEQERKKAAELGGMALGEVPNKLKSADAVHVATAMYAKADIFFTTDRGILTLARSSFFDSITISPPRLTDGQLMLPLND